MQGDCELTYHIARVIEKTLEPTQAIINRLLGRASTPSNGESKYITSESNDNEHTTSAPIGNGGVHLDMDEAMEGSSKNYGLYSLASSPNTYLQMRKQLCSANSGFLGVQPGWRLITGTPTPAREVEAFTAHTSSGPQPTTSEFTVTVSILNTAK